MKRLILVALACLLLRAAPAAAGDSSFAMGTTNTTLPTTAASYWALEGSSTPALAANVGTVAGELNATGRVFDNFECSTTNAAGGSVNVGGSGATFYFADLTVGSVLSCFMPAASATCSDRVDTVIVPAFSAWLPDFEVVPSGGGGINAVYAHCEVRMNSM